MQGLQTLNMRKAGYTSSFPSTLQQKSGTWFHTPSLALATTTCFPIAKVETKLSCLFSIAGAWLSTDLSPVSVEHNSFPMINENPFREYKPPSNQLRRDGETSSFLQVRPINLRNLSLLAPMSGSRTRTGTPTRR
jgi:hypothetical protein